jgi:hypothetical protein
MKAIHNDSLKEDMRPMLMFEVHVTSQGCLYNLLSYYGIITETDGNILTAMQSEGVTVLQFINLMNKHDILSGSRPHNYMVVRELFPMAIEALTRFLRIIEVHSSALVEEDMYTYAVFIKLYPLNYKPNTREHSEIGHWVSISYSRAHGWRFVDPQFLSCSTTETGERRTVPRTHVASSLEHVLSMIQPGYEAIDFILIEPCSSREPPHCLNPLCSEVFKEYIGHGTVSRDLRGGKTRKLRLKSKSRRKPKPHNKTRTRFNKSRPGSSSDSDGGGMRRRVMSKKRKFKSKMKTRTNRRAVQ